MTLASLLGMTALEMEAFITDALSKPGATAEGVIALAYDRVKSKSRTRNSFNAAYIRLKVTGLIAATGA